MPRLLRVALPVGALAVIGGLALAWVATRAPSPNAPCGANTTSDYLTAVMAPAQGIAGQEADGGSERFALATVLGDQALARGVQMHNIKTIRHQLLVLLYNHQHIVRLRVMSGGRLVMDIGGPDVLQPVSGPLRLGGRQVGRVEISIQDDKGYMLLAKRLVGANVVERFGRQTEISDIAVGSRPLPTTGQVTIAGTHYLVGSFLATRFPTGRLRISVLVPPPPRALARQTCAGIRADVYLDVAQRVYDAALTGPSETVAAQVVSGSVALRQALATGAAGAVQSAVSALAGTSHVIALRVSRAGRLVAQAGPTKGTIAPVTGALRGPGGQLLGSYALSVQTGAGSIGISGSLIDAPILMRVNGHVLPGTSRGPRKLPRDGVVHYRGGLYAVRSFLASAFPNGSLRVYVLVPQ